MSPAPVIVSLLKTYSRFTDIEVTSESVLNLK